MFVKLNNFDALIIQKGYVNWSVIPNKVHVMGLRWSNVILLVGELPHEFLRVSGVLVQQHS
jgi:hypothetical protein